MSPNTPASATPMASITAMQPSGISSIAARVERGEDQEAGVARSSRAGTKRSVKARPAMRGCPAVSGCGPFIQVRRMPFFSNTVVIVAVVIRHSVERRAVSVMLGQRSCSGEYNPHPNPPPTWGRGSI
jgi:hypothetical protein